MPNPPVLSMWPAPSAPCPTTESLPVPAAPTAAPVVLSFDVEEHYRIEAAAGLTISPQMRSHCRDRVDVSTRRLLAQLERHGARATFFIVGQTARDNPALVRDIHRAGHEVASHGWDHRRVHAFTPETFRADIRQSKDALEQVTGEAVVGYRAPTFSVMRKTAWALDVLADEGLGYDSSIYPVYHDRYGVPDAPRTPFLARGTRSTLLELPLLTWRSLGWSLPVGGGGYFRLFPLWLMRRGIAQMSRWGWPAVAMLYFHPWEFDVEQERLPLGRLSRFRTYVGIRRSTGRLEALLKSYAFSRAVDVAERLRASGTLLPSFALGGEESAEPEYRIDRPAPVTGAVEG